MARLSDRTVRTAPPGRYGDGAVKGLMLVVRDGGSRAWVLRYQLCKADPVAGAKANVVGTVNVFEAARRHGLKRLAYASSIAALGMAPGAPWLATLYGAYKACDEMIGRVYFQDWGVPSVGLRPGVVYGVGRDQGLTSTTTVAILAAAAGVPYTVPFTGPVSALHAGEAASAFLRAVAAERDAAPVFDLNGAPTTVERWLEVLRTLAPGVRIEASGEPLPFPADLSDAPVRGYLGDYGAVPVEEGVRATFEAFRELLGRGALSQPRPPDGGPGPAGSARPRGGPESRTPVAAGSSSG